MEAKTNYTIVGAIVTLLSAALIVFALWLSMGFNQQTYNIYTVYIHEAVSGLSEDAPVKYNGVQVGVVKKIALNHQDPRQVRLLLSIQSDTPITTSTKATLISLGITGTTYVGLSASTGSLAPLQKIPGEPYPIIPAKPSLFNQFDKALRDVSENINKVSIEIRNIFSSENATRLKKILANIQTTSDVITANSKQINESLQHGDILLTNLAKASKDFPRIMEKIDKDLQQMDRLTESATTTSNKVGQTMDAGKIAIDKFSSQTLPPAIVLINRLNAIAENLEKVSKQLKQNPSILIRGTTPPSSGPGE